MGKANPTWVKGMRSLNPNAPAYPPDVDGQRVCNRCFETKALELFPLDRGSRKRRCRQCDSARRVAEHYANSSRARWYNIFRLYGVTKEQWLEQWRLQGEVCACCGRSDPGKSSGQWQTEHDHKTGKFRGITCGPCNSIIGLAQDSIERLTQAIAYLERNK